jgi:hypothetical protein
MCQPLTPSEYDANVGQIGKCFSSLYRNAYSAGGSVGGNREISLLKSRKRGSESFI